MQNSTRIIVFAYSEVGYQCLKLLIERKENIVGVFTHEDNPEETLWFQSVYALAREYHLPVFTPEKINTPEQIQIIHDLKPDLIFSFYYRNMISPAILNAAPLGAYNMHGSLLPKYRGRAPINWAILHGETETGVTLHEMVEKPDAGDIIDQEAVSINFTDTAKIVFEKIVPAACAVLARNLESLKTDSASRTKQNLQKGQYFTGRKPEDGLINWSQSAIQIYNLIRAVTHPYPGAFTYYEGKKLTIWWATPHENNTAFSNQNPGEIVSTSPLLIQTGEGLLELTEITWENEKTKLSIGHTFFSSKMAK